MRLKNTIILLAFGCSIAAAARGAIARQIRPGGHVTAELLADVSSIQPGTPFTVGVRFKIAPKWHIYWINPGESGSATEVKFDLPPGYTVGELQFPAPRTLRLPGPITSFGYEDEVMLLARVTPPRELQSGATQKLQAHAEWLECEDACVPGEAKLSIALPASDSATPARPANQELFSTWSSKVPTVLSSESAVTARAVGKGCAYEVRTDWYVVPQKVEFFAGPSDDVEFRDVNVRSQGNSTVVAFRVEPLKGRSMPTKPIRCVVASVDPKSGAPTAGFAYDIPMSAALSGNGSSEKR